MEYFWSDGGNNRPDFTYRYTLKEVTSDMHHWCSNYPLDGPFQRWHIIRNFKTTYDGDLGDRKEIPLIQFEDKNAAFMFSLAFSEYILEDKTYEFARKP
jgi:hypothetical protein